MKKTSKLVSDYMKKRNIELEHDEITKLSEQIDLAKGLKTSKDVDKFLKSKLGEQWQTELIREIEEKKRKDEIVMQQFLEQENLSSMIARMTAQEEEEQKEIQIQQLHGIAQSIQDKLLKDKLAQEPVKESAAAPTIYITPEKILQEKLTVANENLAQKKEEYKELRISTNDLNRFVSKLDKSTPIHRIDILKEAKDRLILSQEKLNTQLNSPDDEKRQLAQKQFDINQKTINLYTKFEGALEGHLKMYDLKGKETKSLNKANYFVSNDMQLVKEGKDFLLLTKNQDAKSLSPEERISGIKTFESQKESICHDLKSAERERRKNMGKTYEELNNAKSAHKNFIENKNEEIQEKNKEQGPEENVDFSMFNESSESIEYQPKNDTPSPVFLSPMPDTITNVYAMESKDSQKNKDLAAQKNDKLTTESQLESTSIKTRK